jgi:hypothetical protein
MNRTLKTAFLLSLMALVLSAAETYQKPPKPILDVLNAPVTPTLHLSPTHDFALQSQTIPYPPIAELAEPMLRIAGMRINPKTNGLHNVVFLTGLTLRKIPSGAEIPLQLPPGARILGTALVERRHAFRLHQHHRHRHGIVDRRHHR